MDIFTVYDDFSVRWDNHPNQAPPNARPLYKIEVEPHTFDQMLGSGHSPHVYRIYDLNKKLCEMSFGNFTVESSELKEESQGIYRVLKFFIRDAEGDKEPRQITFTGKHDGGLVHKIPAIMNELKTLQTFGSWKNKTKINEMEKENVALKEKVTALEQEKAELLRLIQQQKDQIMLLVTEIEVLKSTEIPVVPPIPESPAV